MLFGKKLIKFAFWTYAADVSYFILFNRYNQLDIILMIGRLGCLYKQNWNIGKQLYFKKSANMWLTDILLY